MTIPDFQTIMLPILKILRDGQPHKAGDLKNDLSAEFGLTEDERAEMLPSGRQTRIGNRTHWALTYLYQAGLVARPERGIVTITDEGRATLGENIDRVDMNYLQAFPSYQEFRRRTKSKKNAVGADRGLAVDTESEPSPEELIQQAVDENTAAVEGEIRERVLALDPTTFERLVVRLLEAMGYGETGSIDHTGKSGDGGIDGMISQDPLGLDRVYMQAKRYARDNVVGRPAIQGFVGALHGFQADRGVFITTSSFSKDAADYADAVNARLILIDGDRLASLMIQYGAGVQADYVATLHRVDEDFFDTI